MFNFIKEVYYVSWGDIKFMRHNVLNIAIQSFMSPLLYLLVFGIGLQNNTDLGNGVPYIAFLIPGIAAMASLNTPFGAISTRLNVQRLYYRSLDEMLMCPVSIYAIVIGKCAQGMIRGLISVCIIFAIGFAVTANLYVTPLLVISTLLSCFTFSFLGVAAALISKSHQTMATFSTLVITPMSFLGGTFFSLDKLPEVFQAILYVLPVTHSSAMMRASSIGWDFPWASLVVLACFCVAFFAIDIYLVKKKRV